MKRDGIITGKSAGFGIAKLMELTCRDCGKKTPRTGIRQFYCPECSTRRDLKRKSLWAENNPPTQAQRKVAVNKQCALMSRAREAGKAVSVAASDSISWDASRSLRFIDYVRISIPFTYASSKNHIYASRKSGHVFLRKEAKAFRDEIVFLVRNATKEMPLFHNKVWIDILVQKPDHRGDAINVLDLVADALKEAVGIDDRWFCVRRIDWQIVKENPMIYIGIGQEDRFDAIVCSYCGQIKPLDAFYKKKNTKMGVGRECKECIKMAGKNSRGPGD